MTTLKQFGFFDIEHLDDSVQQLLQIRRNHADAHEKEIVQYLENGYEFLMSLGVAKDLLDPQHKIIGIPNVLTDGQWAWTSDVSYYVQKYHIVLPEEFVRHMAENNWICPKINDPCKLRLN
jgi:hypothetical protein